MVKFSRNDTDKARAAVRSLCKAKASNTTYNTPEVNAALVEMFHGKELFCMGITDYDKVAKMSKLSVEVEKRLAELQLV